MKLRKTIAVLSALTVTAVTSASISAQVITPSQTDASLKTYEINVDTLHSLMFKCGLDYIVNADEENGVITFTSKDGSTEGTLVTFKAENCDDGRHSVKAVSDAEADASEVEYCITVCTEIDE